MDTATTEIYTLSLHDALPICRTRRRCAPCSRAAPPGPGAAGRVALGRPLTELRSDGLQEGRPRAARRSEEHTSELQSLRHLVCRLLLEKKKEKDLRTHTIYNT